MLLGLFEAGVEPPAGLVGVSVGALNATALAAYPSLAGAAMLREIWRSRLAREVFRMHPVGVLLSRFRTRDLGVLPGANVRRLIERVEAMTGITAFEQLKVPLAIVATDIGAGAPAVFRSGPLADPLAASTAIPGLFPGVTIEGREYMDGGIVQNTPLQLAVDGGAKEVLAVSLMAGTEVDTPVRNWATLAARTLQLSLHHQMLSEYERVRARHRVVVICPLSAPTEGLNMSLAHVEAQIERSRAATRDLLDRLGSRLFRHSGIHYLDLTG